VPNVQLGATGYGLHEHAALDKAPGPARRTRRLSSSGAL